MTGRESGSALLVALAALAVTATGVMVVALQLDASSVAARHDGRRAVLDALVDAAFAEALAELASDPSFQGRSRRPFGQGAIESSARPSGPDARSVVAAAWYRGWIASIEAEVRVGEDTRVEKARRTLRLAPPE